MRGRKTSNRSRALHIVIPAQAGIQQRGKTGPITSWVPACAGMTNWGLQLATVVNGYKNENRK